MLSLRAEFAELSHANRVMLQLNEAADLLAMLNIQNVALSHERDSYKSRCRELEKELRAFQLGKD